MHHARRFLLGLCTLVTLILLLAPVSSADMGCWECWDPGTGVPDPCRNELWDVAIVPGTGGNEAWAVGDMGTILHLQAGVWSKVASPTTTKLYSVAAASTSLALASGQDGVVLEWNGTSWAALSGFSGGGDYFRSVAFVPGTAGADGWASGDGPGGIGKFHHWNGSQLETQYGGSTHFHYGSCYDMDLLSADSGFAANQYIGKGNVYQWDGAWWNMTEVSQEPMWGVAAISASDVWAVGEEAEIYHFDGANWTAYAGEPTEDHLYDVEMVNGSFGWAVGESGEMLRWDGASWSSQHSGLYDFDLNAVAFEGTAYGWAVGEGGVILFWNGSTWTRVWVPEYGKLEGLGITPGTNGADMWAAGDSQNLFHWNGATWHQVPGPAGVWGYYGVGMLNANDGWAAGWGGKMVHWDGASWSLYSENGSVKDVHMIAANDAWGLGYARFRHWDGANWCEVANPNDISIYGSHMVAADDIWAVGTTRKIARFDGSSWYDVPHGIDLGYSSVLWDVGMAAGSSEGYVGGSNGKLLKWNGSSWSLLDYLSDGYYTMRNVDVVTGARGAVGWVIADDGKALRIENGRITKTTIPTGNMVWDLAHVSPYEAWAVGENGVILHWLSGDQPNLTVRQYLPMLTR